MRAVGCGLWTVDCGLWTVDCGMGTADCRLGIKYGLGIKRGLRTGYKIRTTDYFGENGAQLVIVHVF